MNNKIFATGIILMFFCLSITSCEPGKKDYCGVTDKRFSCTGYLGLDDNYIVFNEIPPNFWFSIHKPYLKLEGETKSIDCTQVIKGDYVDKGLETGRKYYFDCIPKAPGRYDMDIDIMHAEPPSYTPVKGETCTRIGDYQAKWQCTAGAYYTITVK
jgi:hypothetical protein